MERHWKLQGIVLAVVVGNFYALLGIPVAMFVINYTSNMKESLFALLLLPVLFIGCNNHADDINAESALIAKAQTKTIRYGMVTGVKQDRVDYYKKLHANPWPAVLKKIKECNINNYSIYLKKIGSEYFLFSYFEYTGNDFSADMKKMAADTATRRWWKETDPCQLPLPDALAKKQMWSSMEEVFHTE